MGNKESSDKNESTQLYPCMCTVNERMDELLRFQNAILSGDFARRIPSLGYMIPEEIYGYASLSEKYPDIQALKPFDTVRFLFCKHAEMVPSPYIFVQTNAEWERLLFEKCIQQTHSQKNTVFTYSYVSNEMTTRSWEIVKQLIGPDDTEKLRDNFRCMFVVDKYTSIPMGINIKGKTSNEY